MGKFPRSQNSTKGRYINELVKKPWAMRFGNGVSARAHWLSMWIKLKLSMVLASVSIFSPSMIIVKDSVAPMAIDS